MKFRIFAALRDEDNQPWVWLACPGFQSRSIIAVSNSETKKTIWCQCRLIDENFRNFYNGDQSRCQIPRDAQGSTPMVISWWYRNALGIQQTGIDIELDVHPANGCASFWDYYRFHPDPTVRLAVGLGMISCLLGVISIVIAVPWCRLGMAIASVMRSLK